MSGEPGQTSVAPPHEEVEPGSGVRIVVEYCEPCGFEATYLELYTIYLSVDFLPGAFEIEINGQLVFSKLENGGFPYEKDVSICSVGRTSWSPYPNSASSYHSTSLS
uniref:Migration and invasion enhancer 1 n=1 Tax=Nomascus leucogenys TaxID=61853 RepID=A0A2I3H425_NOMLE